MSNIGSYESRVKDFNWKMAEVELGYGNSGKYNIGYYCSDRICEMGNGKKIALTWEGHTGEVKQFEIGRAHV
jgi:hypothetical protein